jgi:hypothetical protein
LGPGAGSEQAASEKAPTTTATIAIVERMVSPCKMFGDGLTADPQCQCSVGRFASAGERPKWE